MRVLVIEDDATMRALLRDVLEREGHRVIERDDGTSLPHISETERFDVVVLDKELPGVDGLDLLSFLSHRLPAVPVVFVTAFGGPSVAAEAVRRGAYRYIEKPFRLSIILTTIAEVATDTVGVEPRGVSSIPLDPPPPPARPGRHPDVPASLTAASGGARSHRPMLSGLRVLVVEDYPAMRKLLGTLLEREGAVVLEASTGREAFEIVRTREFDVALTDLGLPDVQGEVVIAHIRAASHERTPVAVLSGANETELARAVAMGADRIFAKPVAWDQVLQYLEGQMAGRSMTRPSWNASGSTS